MARQKEIQKFDEEIKAYFNSKYKRYWSMDGIINEDLYFDAEERILWIMKEPNSMKGADMRTFLLGHLIKPTGSLWGATTFSNLLYVSYGILNKKLYGDIPYYYEDDTIVKSIQQIAFINIKKKDGISQSNDNELAKYYGEDREYILRQIEMFEPTVIIGANTYQFMKENDDINFKKAEDYRFEYVGEHIGIHSSKDKILFDAYHPNARISPHKYCDSIIENYLKWRKENPKYIL